VQNSKELQLKRATLLGECKDPASKLSALKSLANKFPDDFDVLNDLVYTLSQANATEEAIQVAQESIQKADPENDQSHLAGIHYLLGDLLRKIGQLDQSIHHLTQSIKYRENYVDAYLALGDVYQKQRQYKKAQKIFHQAIGAAPDDPRPYVNAAIAHKDGKDFHTAEDLLRKAVELAPQEVAIRKQLAAVIAINLVQNPSQAPLH
jgi:tetratricopeptide (TPR) repeat protein